MAHPSPPTNEPWANAADLRSLTVDLQSQFIRGMEETQLFEAMLAGIQRETGSRHR